jgi:hypothetical protein
MLIKNTMNLTVNKENYIYLGLIRTAIWENADSSSLGNGFQGFTGW